MGQYIKYQRFVKEFENEEEIQPFLDELIKGGWDIISYQEQKSSRQVTLPSSSTIATITTISVIDVTIMAGKTANQIKNVL